MPAKRFFLDDTKSDYIVISWDGYYKNVRISHNGFHLGGFNDIHELRRGFTFNLYDGSQLQIYLSSEFNNAGLKVNRNGVPVPGSSGHPLMKLKAVFVFCAIYGIINIILGIMSITGDYSGLVGFDNAWIEIAFGILVAAVGYCAWEFKSVAALIAIMILILSNVAVQVIAHIQEHDRPATIVVFYKVFVFITMFRGFRAIREYKHMKKPGDNMFPPPSPFQPQ